MNYYDDLSRQEIESYKVQQKIATCPVTCPVCFSPLRAATRQRGIRWACMNVVNCSYVKFEKEKER